MKKHGKYINNEYDFTKKLGDGVWGWGWGVIVAHWEGGCLTTHYALVTRPYNRYRTSTYWNTSGTLSVRFLYVNSTRRNVFRSNKNVHIVKLRVPFVQTLCIEKDSYMDAI